MTKKQFNELLLRIANDFSSATGNEPWKITRDYFRFRSKELGFSNGYYTKFYGDFKTAVEKVLKKKLVKYNDREVMVESYTRDSFDRVKQGKIYKNKTKIYFVSAVIAGCGVNSKFLESIKHFLKERNAQLVLLPMRGVNFYDDVFDNDSLALADFFSSEFIFNHSLRAYDMRLNPQQRDPLIGFDILGHKGYSCIFASPKQFMRSVPISINSKLPHLLYSTGTISRAEYRNTRVGRLAAQDHVFGGLIVEVFDEKFFDIRPIQADSNGGFYDGYRYYTPNGVETVDRVSAFVVPDWHNGFEDPKVVDNWIKICAKLQPESIVFHDLFDGRSINHYEIGKYITKASVPEFINTLQKELDLLVIMLDKWSVMFPNSKLVIVRSNHDERLDRYLDEGRYCNDPLNHRLSLELAMAKFDGLNPLEYYYRKHRKSTIDNVIWLKIDEDYIVCGFQLGIHGHLGANGTRGSKIGLEKSYGKSISGHVHTPSIFRNTIQVGCTCFLNLDYTKGPSSRLNTSAIVYPNGTFTLINSINGRIGSVV
ncbi:MAG: hypothetical protein ABIK31_07830 [candidate division WOR-3 bacterium]